MLTNEHFFESPSEQSKIKAKIVVSYFAAWTKVMRDHWSPTIPIKYIDLFCGPGIYKDGTKSVPLFLIEKVLEDPKLSQRMTFTFNDRDEKNIENLKATISNIPHIENLSDRIKYSTYTVDFNFERRIVIPKNIPVLSFVDPFGYKGITRGLISKLIENNGSDCIFFFNYNRINMALSSNTKFDEYLAGIFGVEKTALLKEQLAPLSPSEREPIVLDAIISVLRQNAGKYVLPFKFYANEMRRTSHFIIFVSKHPQGGKIMKDIMYANSAKDIDGVATFEFKDSHNFNNEFEQLSMFNRPLQSLCDDLYDQYKGTKISVQFLCNRYACDVSNYFVPKNVKDALRRLEVQDKIVVYGRTRKTYKGELTMPDRALIEFK